MKEWHKPVDFIDYKNLKVFCVLLFHFPCACRCNSKRKIFSCSYATNLSRTWENLQKKRLGIVCPPVNPYYSLHVYGYAFIYLIKKTTHITMHLWSNSLFRALSMFKSVLVVLWIVLNFRGRVCLFSHYLLKGGRF